jgi:riboflavin biosynthesis pyrimidine reductase
MSLIPLYPEPGASEKLEGHYLGLDLHRQAGDGEIMIYANFISSVDGRIALRDAKSGEQSVPKAIANRRDWRLYQELAAQADIVITSARYFRQLAKGHAQDLLPLGPEAEFDDLRRWRKGQGLADQPAVAILSRSLEIPPQAIEAMAGRRVFVFTSAGADAERIEALERAGVRVIEAGSDGVEGLRLQAALVAEGFRSAYMIAGPEVHRTLLAAGVLDRLFLTLHHTLLGGSDFHTIVEGAMERPSRLLLVNASLDTKSPTQMFCHYRLMSDGAEFAGE